MLQSLSHRKGFTLIELMVTGTIIAVLAAAGIISYTSANKRSRDTRRISDLEQIRNALEQYRADNGYYPSSTGNWINTATDASLKNALVSGTPQYMPVLPKDPASYSYWYQSYTPVGGNYYSYCVCACVDSLSATNTCPNSLPGSNCNTSGGSGCNYGLKNP